MNSNIHLRKTNLRRISKLFRIISGSIGRLDVDNRSSFTEFGGEIGDEQRPALERNDMKLGPFN